MRKFWCYDNDGVADIYYGTPCDKDDSRFLYGLRPLSLGILQTARLNEAVLISETLFYEGEKS